MVKRIPFADIKSAVSIDQVMRLTEVDFKKDGKSLRAECPVHKGGKRSLVVSPNELDKNGDKGCWYCHASSEGGDRISLLAHIRQTGQYVAFQTVAEAYCPQLLGDPPKTVPEEKPQEKEDVVGAERGFKPLPYLQPDHSAVTAIGFLPDIAEALGIGLAPRGVHRGRVAIPLRLADGAIAGYISISEDSSVKLPPKWHL